MLGSWDVRADSGRAQSSDQAASPKAGTRSWLGSLAARGARLLALANHDFCPGANRYFRFWQRPIGWLIAVDVAAALLALFVSPGCWALVAALTAILVIGAVWPWLASRCVRVECALGNGSFQEGDSVRVTLRVVNRAPWPIHGLVVVFPDDPEVSGDIPLGTGLALARVGGWSEATFDFQVRVNRRGQFPRQQPVLVQGFPFGIWFARRPIDQVQSMVIRPWSTGLGEVPFVSPGAWFGPIEGADGIGEVGVVSGFRDWRDSDVARRIDWVQTARRDRMIVRERSTTSRPSLHLAILDAIGGAGDSERQEEAIRWWVSVVRTLVQAGWEVRCRRRGRWESIGDRSGWERWSESVALDSWDDLANREMPELRPGQRGWCLVFRGHAEELTTVGLWRHATRGVRLDDLSFLWEGREVCQESEAVEQKRQEHFRRCWASLRKEAARVGA